MLGDMDELPALPGRVSTAEALAMFGGFKPGNAWPRGARDLFVGSCGGYVRLCRPAAPSNRVGWGCR